MIWTIKQLAETALWCARDWKKAIAELGRDAEETRFSKAMLDEACGPLVNVRIRVNRHWESYALNHPREAKAIEALQAAIRLRYKTTDPDDWKWLDLLEKATKAIAKLPDIY